MIQKFQIILRKSKNFQTPFLKKIVHNMMESSHLSHIENPPKNPIEYFKKIVSLMHEFDVPVFMNLSTINSEFGVLNRTLMYRGLTNDNDEENIIFVTEKNSKKYNDIKNHPLVALSILFRNPESFETYQIRLNGIVEELAAEKISALWQDEPLFAKIRSKITKCGKPVDWNTIKSQHDETLQAFNNGTEKLEQTESYTAFKVVPNVFDFYYCELNSIADRVVYRRNDQNSWTYGHVYP